MLFIFRPELTHQRSAHPTSPQVTMTESHTQGHDTHKSWGFCPQKQPHEKQLELLSTHHVHQLQSGTAWHQGGTG
jgi:hypothetical protein